jgi:hypothetical protein
VVEGAKRYLLSFLRVSNAGAYAAYVTLPSQPEDRGAVTLGPEMRPPPFQARTEARLSEVCCWRSQIYPVSS